LPVTVTDPLNHTTTTNYDTAGRVLSVTDPLGNTTSFGYDALDRVVTTTDPLGHTTSTSYDAAGRMLAVTDPLGNVTSFGYDAADRQITVTDPLGRVTSYGYDAAGRLVTLTDPRGNTSTVGYDAADRVVTLTDPLGFTTTTAYDAAGNAVTTIDALGHRTTVGYDALNRAVSVTDPLGNTTSTSYDAVGNVLAVKDPLGHTTSYGYDALNRQVTVTDPLGARTTTAYDAASRVVSLTDPLGNRTTWAYDAAGRVTTETDPLNHSATYAYDAADRLTSTTDRLGRRTDSAYDAAGRLTSVSWFATGGAALQTETYAYDAADRLTAATDPDGAYTLTYDAAGQVTHVAEPFGVALTFGYDGAGNRTRVEDSLGGVTTVTFDARNLQTSEEAGGTGVTSVKESRTYTALGLLDTVTRQKSSGGWQTVGTTTYGYDAASRVTGITDKDGSSTALATYAYGYDAADRLTSKTERGATTTYAYDTADQLTQDGATTLSYDAGGNRNMSGYATGAGNRTTSDGVWTYTYDAEGNLTKKSKGAAADTWTYAYDNDNQLTGASESATDGGAVTQQVTYTYDALGNRIQRQAWDGAATTTERYALDGWDPATAAVGGEGFAAWADLDGSNALTTRRLFGPAAGAPVERQTAVGTVSWYLTDQVGSVRTVTDNTGTATGTVGFDAFGTLTSGTPADRYAYAGMQRDGLTGEELTAARAYQPGVGQFAQEDPLGFGGEDANVRRYVGNTPTTLVDPSGLLGGTFSPGGGGGWNVGGGGGHMYSGLAGPGGRIIADPVAGAGGGTGASPAGGGGATADPLPVSGGGGAGKGTFSPGGGGWGSGDWWAHGLPSGVAGKGVLGGGRAWFGAWGNGGTGSLPSGTAGKTPPGGGGQDPIVGGGGGDWGGGDAAPPAGAGPTTRRIWVDTDSRGGVVTPHWETVTTTAPAAGGGPAAPASKPAPGSGGIVITPDQKAQFDKVAATVTADIRAKYGDPNFTLTFGYQERPDGTLLVTLPTDLQNVNGPRNTDIHFGIAHLLTTQMGVGVDPRTTLMHALYGWNRPGPTMAPPREKSWWESFRDWNEAQYQQDLALKIYVHQHPGEAWKTFTDAIGPVYAYKSAYQKRVQDGQSPFVAFYTAQVDVGVGVISHAYHRTAEVYNQQRQGGENVAMATYLTVLYGLASAIGVADGYEAVTGTDIRTGEELSGTDRVAKGFLAFGQFVSSMAGGAGALEGTAAKVGGEAGAVARAPKAIPVEPPLGGPIKPPVVEPPVLPEVPRLPKSCFPAGTLVATEFGLRAIEAVAAGERVWAFDLVTGEWRLCPVLHTYHLDYSGRVAAVTVAGEVIEATYKHPVWVARGAGLDDRPRLDHLPDVPAGATVAGRWVDAGDLRAGDVVLLRDGLVTVEAVRVDPFVGRVYNFEVDDLHCYAVGQAGVLVHNNNGPEPPLTGGPAPTGGVGTTTPKTSIDVPQPPKLDRTDATARTHILDGDRTGGGHRYGTGNPRKSEFPPDWDDAKILGEISEIAYDPATVWSLPDARGYVTATKMVDGVLIQVVYDTVNHRIVSGYPLNIPRNPRIPGSR
jgi:RHS repeat-associated protein